MKKFTLDYERFREHQVAKALTFVKPIRSKLYRLHQVHNDYYNQPGVVDLLFEKGFLRQGIFFFNLPELEMHTLIYKLVEDLSVPCYLLEPHIPIVDYPEHSN